MDRLKPAFIMNQEKPATTLAQDHSDSPHEPVIQPSSTTATTTVNPIPEPYVTRSGRPVRRVHFT